VGEEGKKVLFEGKKVPLAMPQPKEKPEARVPKLAEKSKTQVLREELFERLVALRKKVAQQHGTPPYHIFSDATLEIMAVKRPVSDRDMLQVSGVVERKLQLYGDAFMEEIRRFILEKTEAGENVTGSTVLVSWNLFKKGQTVEQIAREREISTLAVMGHLASMYERGETIDIGQWVSPEECDIIQGALSLFDDTSMLKPIYEHFQGRYSYDKIRWAVADWKRSNPG
jgi:ATP-dependent DNA helicase RecQ